MDFNVSFVSCCCRSINRGSILVGWIMDFNCQRLVTEQVMQSMSTSSNLVAHGRSTPTVVRPASELSRSCNRCLQAAGCSRPLTVGRRWSPTAETDQHLSGQRPATEQVVQGQSPGHLEVPQEVAPLAQSFF